MKLRLSKEYAFGLMARLYGKETAFRVLQLTEEVENLGGVAVTIASAVALYLHLPPSRVAAVCAVTSLCMTLVKHLGLYIPPVTWLLLVSRIYSILVGRGFFLIPLTVWAYAVGGWTMLGAMFGARIAAAVCGEGLDLLWSWQNRFQVTTSELSFFHAYRLLAKKHGITTDLGITKLERMPGAWFPTYTRLEADWPIVVARFSYLASVDLFTVPDFDPAPIDLANETTPPPSTTTLERERWRGGLQLTRESIFHTVRQIIRTVVWLGLGLIAFGFWAQIKSTAPAYAQVYLDPDTSRYFPPPLVREDQRRAMLLSTIEEARRFDLQPDERSVNLGGFVQAERSLNGYLLQKVGILGPVPSRWNEDGSWNW